MHPAAMIDAIFSDNNYIATKKLLDATSLRHEAIAANIANIETPGYKRVDLPKNFSEEFAAQLRDGHPDQISLPALAPDPDAQSQRLDGNNVEMDGELLAMSSNSMQYETLTEFVSDSLKQLKMAITGQT
jgi:flagellar basal-body rod protein FlgB